MIRRNDPQNEIRYLLTCAPNQDSNQPVHTCSLINLCCPHEKTSEFQNVPSENSDQPVQMHRLILIFTGHTCLKCVFSDKAGHIVSTLELSLYETILMSTKNISFRRNNKIFIRIHLLPNMLSLIRVHVNAG